VSCISADVCIAVGQYYPDSSSYVTLAERWNGTRWTIQTTPHPIDRLTGDPRLGSLSTVSCASASYCIAVGNNNSSSPLTERWDGKHWAILPTPPAPPASKSENAEGAGLHGVSCLSATECTAVGSYSFDRISDAKQSIGRTLAEDWNGKRWTIQPTPSPSGAAVSVLNAVSCVSASACTAVGRSGRGLTAGTLAERWNGRRWTIQATPNASEALYRELDAVSCNLTSVCTAVCSSASAAESLTLAERWNAKR
jgi:hypothetical protein